MIFEKQVCSVATVVFAQIIGYSSVLLCISFPSGIEACFFSGIMLGSTCSTSSQPRISAIPVSTSRSLRSSQFIQKYDTKGQQKGRSHQESGSIATVLYPPLHGGPSTLLFDAACNDLQSAGREASFHQDLRAQMIKLSSQKLTTET